LQGSLVIVEAKIIIPTINSKWQKEEIAAKICSLFYIVNNNKLANLLNGPVSTPSTTTVPNTK
jgi:hypothetical protein